MQAPIIIIVYIFRHLRFNLKIFPSFNLIICKMLIGAHLSIANGIEGLIEQIKYLNINTFQFFLSGPQNWKTSRFISGYTEKFRNLRRYVKIITVHSPYIVNLASLDNKLRNMSKHKIHNELELANNLGIDYYIMHPGSPKCHNVEAGIQHLTSSLNTIISKINNLNTKILIEWSVGEGFEIGKNLQEIKNIIDQIIYKNNIGICLDTCHMFGSGINISDKLHLDNFKSNMKSNELLEFVKVIHANDTKGILGSKKDRHEHIGKGHIGLQGFKNFIQDDYFSTLPFIIETPKEDDMDKININLLRSLFTNS